MKYYRLKFNISKKRMVVTSIILFFILDLTTIIILLFPNDADALQLRQKNQISILLPKSQPSLSPTITSSLTLPNSPTPTVDEHVQQLISEAQNDISSANTVIYWTGFIFAVIVGLVTVGVGIAGFFGIREFRDLFRNYQQIRTDIALQIQQTADQIQQMTALKKQIEDQNNLFTNRIESELKTVENQRVQFTNQINSRFQTVEDLFRQLTKATEIQSIMDASYHFGIATNAYEVGDNVRAIESYLEVLKLQPNNTKVLERLGRAYSNINETDKSVEYLERALDIDPNYAPALRSLALTYRYSQKAKAIDYLERETKINPFDFEGWDFLGLLYRDQGLFDKAIDAHERALALKKRPETQFYLSILYSLKGDKELAQYMARVAENGLSKKEHDRRIRPVWKILIRAGVPILDGKKEEALRLIQALTPYITTQRIYDALKGHIELLLTGTDHKDWITDFMEILKFERL